MSREWAGDDLVVVGPQAVAHSTHRRCCCLLQAVDNSRPKHARAILAARSGTRASQKLRADVKALLTGVRDGGSYFVMNSVNLHKENGVSQHIGCFGCCEKDSRGLWWKERQ